MRIAKTDFEMTLASGSKYKFRKGDRVGLCPPLFHLDEELFPNPTDFNPSRWLLGEDKSTDEKVQAACGKMAFYKGGKELPR